MNQFSIQQKFQLPPDLSPQNKALSKTANQTLMHRKHMLDALLLSTSHFTMGDKPIRDDLYDRV